jgi:hypothetical protein
VCVSVMEVWLRARQDLHRRQQITGLDAFRWACIGYGRSGALVWSLLHLSRCVLAGVSSGPSNWSRFGPWN